MNDNKKDNLKCEVQEEYEVEAILDKKLQSGTTFYLIKWKGYGVQDNSWEPYQNLINAEDLLEIFLKCQKSNKKMMRDQKPIIINLEEKTVKIQEVSVIREKKHINNQIIYSQKDQKIETNQESQELAVEEIIHLQRQQKVQIKGNINKIKKIKKIKAIFKKDNTKMIKIQANDGRSYDVEYEKMRKHCPYTLLRLYQDQINLYK